MKNGKKLLSFILIALSSVFCIGSLNLKPSVPSFADTTTNVAKTYTANSLKVGDVIEYGEYPQTFVAGGYDYVKNNINEYLEKDAEYSQNGYYVVKKAFNDLKAGEKVFILNVGENYNEKYPYAEYRDGVYKTGSSLYGTKNDPRKYVDDVKTGTYSNKDTYKQVATKLTDSNSGNVQSTIKYNSNSTKYMFKVEPLRWRITYKSGSVLTLACMTIVDAIDYNLFDSNGNMWAYSYIRNWLNGGSGYSEQKIGVAYNVQNSTSGNRQQSYNWFDWGDYGFGNSTSLSEGSRNSILVDSSNLNNNKSGSFFLRAFSSSERNYILKQTRTSRGAWPDKEHNYTLNYSNGTNNPATFITVDDYVTLVSTKIWDDKAWYRNDFEIDSYSDYAVANGFVDNFEYIGEINSISRKRTGNYGYIWTAYSDSDEFSKQLPIYDINKKVCVHNMREAMQINLSTFSESKLYANTWTKIGFTATNIENSTSDGSTSLGKVNSMDQSYGVVPQIKIDTQSVEYLNRVDEYGVASVGSENTIVSSTSDSNRKFSLGKFDYSLKPGVKLDFYGATGTSGNWTITGKVVSGKVDANDYIKVVVSNDPLNTTSYVHPINNSLTYIYVKGSEIKADGSFTVKTTRNATVTTLYVYGFYCSSDLRTTWAIEDASQAGKTANLRYDTVILETRNANNEVVSTKPIYLFKGMTVTLPATTVGAGQVGYWFAESETEELAKFIANPNDYKPEDAKLGKTIFQGIENHKVPYDGTVRKYINRAGTLSHSVSVAGADGTYYFIYNNKNIYPQYSTFGADGYKLVENSSSAINTQIKLRIKYPYINSYINEDGTINKPTVNIVTGDDTRTKIDDAISDDNGINIIYFTGTTSQKKELEFTIDLKDSGSSEKNIIFEIIHPDNQSKIDANKYQITFNTGEGDLQTAKFGDTKVGKNERGDINDTTIKNIEYGTSVNTNLKFNTGYYIPSTTNKQGTLGFNVPKMTFSYAGIVTDNNGYRYADGAYYPADDTTNAYAGELIRIDNSGAGIDFDAKENRKYYLSISGGTNSFDGIALVKQPDGSYFTSSEGVTDNKVGFGYSVLFKPVYRVYVNGSETPIVIDSTNENVRFDPKTNQYILSEKTGEIALNKYAITVLDNNDLVNFTKADKDGNVSEIANEYRVSNIKISTFRDEVQSAEKDNKVQNVKVEVDYVVFSVFNNTATKEQLEKSTAIGDEENTKATYNVDRLYDYGLTYTNNAGNTITYTMSISSSNTRYYNPWVEYVNDVSIIVNGTQYNDSNKFVPFKSQKGEHKTDMFNFSTGRANKAYWEGYKMWFYTDGNTITQFTSFTDGGIPTAGGSTVIFATNSKSGKYTGLGSITINGITYTVFSIDGVDVQMNYNIDENKIDINYSFDFVASNIEFGFSGVADYDYSVNFLSSAGADTTVASTNTVNGTTLIVNNKNMLKNKDTGMFVGSSFDFTNIPNLRSYVDAIINGENVMVFTPITINLTDYYLCPGKSVGGWAVEQSNGTSVEYKASYNGDELSVYKLINGSDYIYIQKYTNAVDYNGTAKQLIGFELLNNVGSDYIFDDADAQNKMVPEGKLKLTNGSFKSYYTFEQILRATYKFDNTYTEINFVAVYDTCSINVSVEGWNATDGNYDAIDKYLKENSTEVDNFKVVETKDIDGSVSTRSYYLKGTLYNEPINTDVIASNALLEGFVKEKSKVNNDAVGDFLGFYRRSDDAIQQAIKVGGLLTAVGSGYKISNSGNFTTVTINGSLMYVRSINGNADLANSNLFRIEVNAEGYVSYVTLYEKFIPGTSKYRSNNVTLISLFKVKMYSVSSDLTDAQKLALIPDTNNVESILSGVVTGKNLIMDYTLTKEYTHTDISDIIVVKINNNEITKLAVGDYELTDGIYNFKGKIGYIVVRNGNNYRVVISATAITADVVVSLKENYTFIKNQYSISLTNPSAEFEKTNNSGEKYGLGEFKFEDKDTSLTKYFEYGANAEFKFIVNSAFNATNFKINIYVCNVDAKDISEDWTNATIDLKAGSTTHGGMRFIIQKDGQTYTIVISNVNDNPGIIKHIKAEINTSNEVLEKITFKKYNVIHTTVSGEDHSVNNDQNIVKIEGYGRVEENIAKNIYSSSFVFGNENTIVGRDGKLENLNTASLLYGDNIKYSIKIEPGYTNAFPIFYINGIYIIPADKLSNLSSSQKELVLGATTITFSGFTSPYYAYQLGTNSNNVEITVKGNEYEIKYGSYTARLNYNVANYTYTLEFDANFSETGTSLITIYADMYVLTSVSGNDITKNYRNKYDLTFTQLILNEDDPNSWKYGNSVITNAVSSDKVSYGDYAKFVFTINRLYTHNLPIFKAGDLRFYIPGFGVDYSADGLTYYNGKYYLNIDTMNTNEYTYKIESWWEDISAGRRQYRFYYYDKNSILLLKTTLIANVYTGFDSDDIDSFTISEREKLESAEYTFEYLVQNDTDYSDGNSNYEKNTYTVAFVKRVLVDSSNNTYEIRGTVKYTDSETSVVKAYIEKVMYENTFRNPYKKGLTNFGVEDGFNHESNDEAWYVYNPTTKKCDETAYSFNGDSSQEVVGHMILAATYTENIYTVVFKKPDSSKDQNYKEYGVFRTNLSGDHSFSSQDASLIFENNIDATINRNIYHSKVQGLSIGYYVYAAYDHTLPVFTVEYPIGSSTKTIVIYMPGDDSVITEDDGAMYYMNGGVKIAITKSSQDNVDIYNYTYDDSPLLSVKIIKNANVVRNMSPTNNSYVSNALSTYYNIWFTAPIKGMTTRSNINVSVSGFGDGEHNGLNEYTLTLKDMNMKNVDAEGKNFTLQADYSDFTGEYNKTYIHGAEFDYLPAREINRGYNFLGWGIDSSLTKNDLFGNMSAGVRKYVLYDNATLYAKFEEKTSKIKVYGSGKIYKNAENKADALTTSGDTVGTITFSDGTTAEKTIKYTDSVVFKVTIDRKYSDSSFIYSILSTGKIQIDSKVVITVSEPTKISYENGTDYVYTVTVQYFDPSAYNGTTKVGHLQVATENVIDVNKYTVEFFAPQAEFDYENMSATFTQVEKYTDISHGNSLNLQGGLRLPTNPTLEGWDFKGWYIATEDDAKSWYNETRDSSTSSEFKTNTIIYKNTSVYAYFVRKVFKAQVYLYNYEKSDGDNGNSKYIVDKSGTWELVDEKPNKASWEYDVKYNNTIELNPFVSVPVNSFAEDKYYYVTDLADIGTDRMQVFYSKDTKVTGNIYLIANYSRKTFNVIFYDENYTPIEEKSISGVFYGSKISVPEYVAQNIGHYFDCWTAGDVVLNENYIVRGDVEFYPRVLANKYYFDIVTENGEVGTVGDDFNKQKDIYIGGNYSIANFDPETGEVILPYTSSMLVKFMPNFGYDFNKPTVRIYLVENGIKTGLVELEYDKFVGDIDTSTGKYSITLSSNLLGERKIGDTNRIFRNKAHFVIEIVGNVNTYKFNSVARELYNENHVKIDKFELGSVGNNTIRIYDIDRDTNVFTVRFTPATLNVGEDRTEIIHGESAKITVWVSNSFNYKSKFRFALSDGITTKHIEVSSDKLYENSDGESVGFYYDFDFEEVKGMLTFTAEEMHIENNDYRIKFFMAFGGGVNPWFKRQAFKSSETWATYTSGYIFNGGITSDDTTLSFADYLIPDPNVIDPSIDKIGEQQYTGTYFWCANVGNCWYRFNSSNKNDLTIANVWEILTRDNYTDYFIPVNGSTTYNADTDLYAFYFMNTANVTIESGENVNGSFSASNTADFHDPSSTDMTAQGYAYSFIYTVNVAYSNNVPIISVVGETSGVDSYDIVVLPYNVYMSKRSGETLVIAKNATDNYEIEITANGYTYYKRGDGVASKVNVVYANGVYSVSEGDFTKFTVTPNNNSYNICLNKINGNFALTSNESTFKVNTYSIVYTTPDGTKHLEEVKYGERVVNIPEVSATFLQKIVYVVKYANGNTETINAKTLKEIEFTQDATIEVKVELNIVIVVLLAVAGAVVIGLIITIIVKAKNNHAYKKRSTKDNQEMFDRLAKDKNNDEHGPKI